jgi:hypothetical protein
VTYQQWALEELGLAGQGLAEARAECPTAQAFKDRVRKRGRALLGKYHPDRHKGSREALARFKALNDVLQRLDNIPIPDVQPEVPRYSVSVDFYPEAHPTGPTIETRTVRRSYFDFMTEETRSSGVRYDAARVVPMRPGKKI